MSKSIIRDAALKLAERGIPSVPIGERKRPLIKYKLEARDPHFVEAWCQKFERPPGFAIVTGPASGLFALDVDCGADFAILDGLGDTVAYRTPSGGEHRIFRSEDDLPNTVSRIADCVDFRGRNGLAIQPPSFRGRYTYLPGRSFDEIEPAPLPAHIAELARRPTTTKSSSQEVVPTWAMTETWTAEILSEGTRNDGLFRFAAGLRGRGADEGQILQELQAKNQIACRPLLDDSELVTIARSAAGYSANVRRVSPLREFGFAFRDHGPRDPALRRLLGLVWDKATQLNSTTLRMSWRYLALLSGLDPKTGTQSLEKLASMDWLSLGNGAEGVRALELRIPRRISTISSENRGGRVGTGFTWWKDTHSRSCAWDRAALGSACWGAYEVLLREGAKTHGQLAESVERSRTVASRAVNRLMTNGLLDQRGKLLVARRVDRAVLELPFQDARETRARREARFAGERARFHEANSLTHTAEGLYALRGHQWP